MSRDSLGFLFGACPIATVTSAMSPAAAAQQGVHDGQWPHYSEDNGSSKCSSLDLIDRENVGDLRVVWTWSSLDNPITSRDPEKRTRGFPVTPLLIDGVMYTTTGQP